MDKMGWLLFLLNFMLIKMCLPSNSDLTYYQPPIHALSIINILLFKNQSNTYRNDWQ